MRIALVIERMEPSRGGRETSTAQIAVALADRGHDVTILCQGGAWRRPGVRVEVLGRRGLLRVTRLIHFVHDAAAAAREGRFDVVHAMLAVAGANVYQPRGGTIPGQVEASRRLWGALGGPRVAVFERLNLCRRVLAQLERRLAADPAVQCLAVSGMVAEEFASHLSRRDGVRVVYNGVAVPDPEGSQRAEDRRRRREELGVGDDDIVLLTLATNFALKGVGETVAAFARWRGRRRAPARARLVVIGRQSPGRFARAARRSGVGAETVFLPPTPAPFEWYAAADACVLLSWYDPCSRVVLEAVRWGIPVITTAYNGAAEVLADGAGIVIASPDETDAAAAAMASLADAGERRRRSDACRAVAERVSIDRHVEGLLAAYAAAREAKA